MSLFRGKSQSTSDQRLNAIPISSSSYGKAVPLLYGQNRISLLLLWYGNFVATPHTSSSGGGKGGGGGSTNTTFTYAASCVMGLCAGPITGIGQVWNDQDLTTISALGLTLFTGAGGQAVWSYLTTNFPTQAVPYDHTAYVAQANMDLGNSAALPNYTFEATGFLPYNAGTVNDAEPSAIWNHYCTDANEGCNFPFLNSGIFSTGTTSYQSYCIAMGFFVSPYEDEQRAAVDFLKEMLQITNSNSVLSAGVLNIVPYCDISVTGNGRTYTPNLTPLFTFTDDDFRPNTDSGTSGTDPVIFTRAPLASTYNRVNVEYLDRTNSYNVAIATAEDSNDIALNGLRVASTFTFHSITTAGVANMVAQLILQRQLYIRNIYQFAVRMDYCLLEPMDIIAIYDPVGGQDKLLRITECDDDENDNFLITAEDMLVGPGAAPAYNFQAVQGFNANWNAAPPSVAPPLIFTIPPLLVDAAGGFELGVWVDQGATGSWSGCDVYTSLDNSSYIYAGTINGGARYGTLTANLPSNADPDITDTLSVALTNASFTTKQLVSGSAADYSNLRTLICVAGEWMAYQTATLTSAGNYNLTTLRRGQYGSTPGAHGVGAAFARLDGAVFRVPFDPGMIGQTIYFKFCSFNVYQRATQALSAVATYQHVLSANNIGQLTPGPLTLVGRGVTVNGNDVFKSAQTVAWDSDVYSLQGYTNGAFLTFQPAVLANSQGYFLALNTDPLTDSSFTSLDYAFYCSPTGLSIYESGTNIGHVGSYSVGNILSITYDGAFVRYLQNGNLLRQVAAAPGLTFYLDSSFGEPGMAATNLQFGPYGTATPVMFIARGGCQVGDASASKTSGTANWDSDAYSINGYTSCHIVCKASQTTASIAIALEIGTYAQSEGTAYTGGAAFALTTSGTYQAYSGGTAIGSSGSYATGDTFAITYDGYQLQWLHNNTLVTSQVIGAVSPIFGQVFFYTLGGALNSLEFGPGATVPLLDTAQVNLNGVTGVATVFDAGPEYVSNES